MKGRIGLVLGEGFRVFFLAGGVFAIFAIAAWEGWFAASLFGAAPAQPFAPAPHLWHAHEMIFGYAGAVLGGFFLTAVPSWTGTQAARRGYIAAAAGLWLAGRLGIWFSGNLDPWLVAAVDLAFLPVLGTKIALQLAKRPKPQNIMLLGLLALIWSGNLLVHLEWTGLTSDSATAGLRTGLLGVAATIAVVGGRVTPAFTRNAMTRAGVEDGLPRSRTLLDAAAIGSAIVLPLLFLASAPDPAVGVVALVAGVTALGRLAGWRGHWTRGQPILWSLHLGFAMLAGGYVLLGLAALGIGSESAGLHLIAIGAVGGMTLAVMSRAALGHTGRDLRVARPVALAYVLVAAAAIVRTTGALDGAAIYSASVLGAGVLWIAGFALFVAVYWRPLTLPRA